jgi:hypothetical protein
MRKEVRQNLPKGRMRIYILLVTPFKVKNDIVLLSCGSYNPAFQTIAGARPLSMTQELFAKSLTGCQMGLALSNDNSVKESLSKNLPNSILTGTLRTNSIYKFLLRFQCPGCRCSENRIQCCSRARLRIRNNSNLSPIFPYSTSAILTSFTTA